MLMCVQVGDHVVDGGVFLLKTKALHSGLQFFRVNATAVVCVKERY